MSNRVSPIDASQINYARVLQVLREEGGASRIELTRRTGLSPATVTGITRNLLEEGYVKIGHMQPSKGKGRPSEILIYDAESRYALGIELHDHSIFGVITDLYARPIQTYRVAGVEDSADSVIENIVEWVKRVSAEMGTKECAAVGLAIPGAVNQNSGKVVFSTEFDLVNVPIVGLIEDQLEQPISAINRAYAAALAEVWLGVAKDSSNVLYIRMGEYLGGAILIDGLPYLGSKTTGVASIAHITVDPDGLPCRCGSHGCLDTKASGNAITRFAREEIKKGRNSTLIDRTNGYLDSITGTMVIEAARQGDSVSQDALAEAARWMGIAVGIIANLLGPDIIVFGGELGRVAGDEFLSQVTDEARRYTYSVPDQTLNLIASALGEEAIACGAAATALWESLTHSINLHIG